MDRLLHAASQASRLSWPAYPAMEVVGAASGVGSHLVDGSAARKEIHMRKMSAPGMLQTVEHYTT